VICGLLVVCVVYMRRPHSNAPVTAVDTKGAAPNRLDQLDVPNRIGQCTVRAASTAPVGQFALEQAQTRSREDRFKYRLSNTTRSVDQLLRDERAILLENALVYTGDPVTLAIPEHLRAKDEPGSYIVQARRAVDDTFRAFLTRSGARIVSYIPNNAYLVRASATVAKRLRASPLAQAVLPFEPYFKFKADLLKLAVEREPLPEQAILTLLLFEDSAADTIRRIEQIGGRVLGHDKAPFGPVVHVKPPTDWTAVAALPGVHVIELSRARMPANDLTRVRLGVAVDPVATTNYMNLTGKDVWIAVADSGVDQSHPDLSGHVVLGTGAAGTDTNGHGTHVAGIIVSSGAHGPDGTNVSGSIDGASFRGIAPEATVYALPVIMATRDIASEGLPAVSDAALQADAAATNALISLNAWNYAGDNSYSIAAASYDAAVRDALPGVPGPQPVLFVFSAGNAGIGSDNGLSGNPDSILAPGTAKNVITVGAIEQLRYITNTVEQVTDGTTNTTTPWLAMTDSANEVARFSSRGNVGIGYEGDRGRFKPDVVAPGTFVLSTRSTHWDTATYYNPIVYHTTRYTDQFTETNSFNYGSVYLPSNTVEVVIEVVPNRSSPVPFPEMPIYLWRGTDPRDPSTDGPFINRVAAPDDVALDPLGTTWWFAISNTTTETVFYDIVTTVGTTELAGYYGSLSNLNDAVGPYYRFESGTSMAAAAAAGTLALIQEYFQKLGITNSPALMKALLINGARSVNPVYDFQVRAPINYQGWGLINLPATLHPALTNNGPVFKFDSPEACSIKLLDQNPTNALATGQSLTWKLEVSSNALGLPLRITLVWTDPPGDPAASVKLVNDLDLIVTNLDTTNVYIGNDIVAGGLFNLPWDGVSPITNDAVNNIENVYLAPPLGTNYAITVVARRVNVNAVTTQTNNVLQDFALVISSGDGEVPDALRIGDNGRPSFLSPSAIEVTYVTNTFQDATTVGSLLLHQRVGASFQLLGTNTIQLGPNAYWATNSVVTLGVTNQWHFYVVTNTQNYTNAAFVTFLPPNLSVPRIGVFQTDLEEEVTREEADIDMYVARGPGNWALTNLDPAVLDSADKAVSRGGTELIVYSNAEPGEVFYIGVKAEDQMAAEYGFLAVFSLLPFSESTEGGIRVQFFPLPSFIPDGDNASPGVMYVFGICVNQVDIRRAIVQTAFEHQNLGDLVGNLSHNRRFAVLNNHHNSTIQPPGPYGFVYEDNGEGVAAPLFTGQNIVFTGTDSPGSLRNFVGEEGLGFWLFTVIDNHLTQTGAVTGFALLLEPQDLTKGMVATVEPQAWKYFSVDVPPEATNLTVILTFLSNSVGPLDLYIRRDAFPTQTEYDKCLLGIVAPGGSLSIGKADSPPLNAGRYYIGVYNPGTTPQTFELKVIIDMDVAGIRPNIFASTNIVSILDDAVITSSIPVYVNRKISRVEVGLAVEHPRVSDLAFTLVSPQGTRVLLFENRGGATQDGLGSASWTTNTVWHSSFESTTPTNFIARVGSYFGEGWFVDTGSVKVVRSGAWGSSPFEGNWYIDINGDEPGVCWTNIATVPGERYVLRFAYARNPDSIWAGRIPEARIWVGTNLLANVRADYINSWSDLAWRTASYEFTASSDQTRLRIESLTGGASGVLFDAVKFEMVGVKYSYVIFTEATNKTATPIKYAQPPFVGISTNIDIGDFESVAAADYTLGTSFGGWVVASNQVTIVQDPPNAYSGNRFVALANGSIIKTLPTTLGKRYLMSFAYRGPGIVGWWRGEGNPNDSISTNNGVPQNVGYVAGVVGQAFNCSKSPPTRIKVPDAPEFRLTNSLSIEGWIYPRADGVIFWRGDRRAGYDPYALAMQTSGELWFHISDESVPANFVYVAGWPGYNRWSHVAGTLDGTSGIMRLYINGALAGQVVTSVRPFGELDPTQEPAVGIGNVGETLFSAPFNGIIDEISLYNRALSASEIRAIYAAGSSGKFDATQQPPESLAKARLLFDGTQIDVLYGQNNSWQTNTIYFSATQPTHVVQIDGVEPGMLLDGFTLLEFADDSYYFAEESLDAFKGENAYGQWQLEVWDTRTGATNPAPVIVSWQLRFLFETVVPPAIGLTHAVPVTTTIGTNEIQYFYVDVPRWARAATNSIVSATGPVNLWFSQNGVPSCTNGPGDYLLLAGVTNGAFTLTSNSVPQLVSARRYYLGVQNTNADPVTFTIMVEFDVITLTNGVPFDVVEDTVYRGRMYQFDVSSNATALAFIVTNLSGNVDLVVRKGLPLPTFSQCDYSSLLPGTYDELVAVFKNTEPVAVSPGRWYAGVFNVDVTNVAYTIVAIELTNPIPPVIDLTNAVPYPNTNSNAELPIDYYRFKVSPNAVRAQFEINGPSGDMALVARKGFPPLPDLDIYDYLSDNPDTNDELIVIFDFSQPVPLTPGEWYLGAVNLASAPVTYSIMATEWTEYGTNIVIRYRLTPDSFCLTWNSLPGAHYVVEGTPSMPPPYWVDVSPTITATSTETTWCVPLPSPYHFFRVREGIALTLVPTELTHGITLTTNVGPRQVKYFYVDVPVWATATTNMLLNASAPVSLLFNQNTLPGTMDGLGDFTLLSGVTSGTFMLTSNSVPPLVAGQRYYLAVSNASQARVTFDIRVEFDVVQLTNGVPKLGTVGAGHSRMYQYDVSSNAVGVVFALTNLSGNVDLLVRKGLPWPTQSSYDYGSFAQGTTNEQIVVSTNSVPVPVAPGRWYLGVVNADTANVQYTIVAAEIAAPPGFITLTNGVGYAGTNYGTGDATDYYRFVVSSNAARAQFEVSGASGPVALAVRRGYPPLPSLSTNDYLSDNPGRNDELVVVFGNSVPVGLSAGDWYLAVVNLSGGAVSYNVKATEWSETGTNIVIGRYEYWPDRLCITWNSLLGVHYVVEGTVSMPAPYWTNVSPTITATSTQTTWCIPLPSPYRFFRVREGLVLTQQLALVAIERIARTPAGVELRWQAQPGTRFQVEWTGNIFAPSWTRFTNVVTSATNNFEFVDDGSQTGGLGPTRFYRLVLLQ